MHIQWTYLTAQFREWFWFKYQNFIISSYWKITSSQIYLPRNTYDIKIHNVSHLAWADFEIKVKQIVHSTVASVTSKMTSKPQQPWRLPSGFYFKFHFWNQWLPLIKMSYRLTYLENFHFSDLLAASEAGCWKFEKWKFSE